MRRGPGRGPGRGDAVKRSTFAALVALAVLAFAWLAPRTAAAQDRRIEAGAKEAMKRARADFSAADYDGGLARLLRASRACGTIRCSATTRAALLRDTGVMQLRRGKGAKAAQLFAEALKIDKRIELVAPYDAPDVRAAWGGASAESGIDESPQPTGDFVHSPAIEQVAGTPVPIYVEYAGSDRVASVVVKYRAEGDADWKRATLPRLGRGWGGLLPCDSARVGIVRYYVQGFDAGGSPNALSGDPKHPFHVAVRRTIVSDPPSLPGQPPPAACNAGESNAEAPPPEKPEAQGPLQCVDDAQCNGGMCSDGHCTAPEHREVARTSYARFWIGISLSLDVAWLPSASDVCKLDGAAPLNAQGYYCTNPGDGSDYPTTTENASLTHPGTAGQVSGGPGIANVRLLGSVDYAFNPNILAGARFGVVMHGYTGSAAVSSGKAFGPPIHAELRGTYLFGDKPLTHAGFSPMVFVDAGFGKFDAVRDVSVTESGVPGSLPKRAWRTGGPVFVGAGGGLRYQFSQRIAFTGALRLVVAFGGNGLFDALGPEVALHYGF